jgi:hypothetical protein
MTFNICFIEKEIDQEVRRIHEYKQNNPCVVYHYVYLN